MTKEKVLDTVFSRALYWYECIEDLDDEEGDGSGMVS
jgi:hypothetical protein